MGQTNNGILAIKKSLTLNDNMQSILQTKEVKKQAGKYEEALVAIQKAMEKGIAKLRIVNTQ